MWKTIDIVPSSIRDDPQVQAACEAIDKEIAEIYNGIPPISFWPNLYEQVPPLLDIMMWEYHVDFYQMIVDGAPLNNDIKRQLIDKSIEWHAHKGTKWCVEQVLQTIWRTAYVTEWYEYGGKPYFFRITVNEDMSDPALYQRAVDAVMAVKNVRSWLEGFVKPRQTSGIVYAGGYLLRRKVQTLPSYKITR